MPERLWYGKSDHWFRILGRKDLGMTQARQRSFVSGPYRRYSQLAYVMSACVRTGSSTCPSKGGSQTSRPQCHRLDPVGSCSRFQDQDRHKHPGSKTATMPMLSTKPGESDSFQ